MKKNSATKFVLPHSNWNEFVPFNVLLNVLSNVLSTVLCGVLEFTYKILDDSKWPPQGCSSSPELQHF